MQEKCAAENVDEIGAKVEISPSKSWTNLYNRCVDIITITTTTTNETKLQHLHPSKTTMINKTYTADTEVELNFENWYPQLPLEGGGGGGGGKGHTAETDPTFILLHHGMWFHPSALVNSKFSK